MPTYDYRCADCGHEFEAQQAFTDDPLSECPSCGGTVKKRFSAVGIAFKGSGFYKNDARGSGSSGSSTSSGSTGGSSSSDTASSSSSGTSTATTSPSASSSAD
ncbi:MAG: FmdB family transcriptional regulator [Acidimicrobiia bacterium]|nr:FmdB family transcriptional regulator [Acidimicrobiia bacterium]